MSTVFPQATQGKNVSSTAPRIGLRQTKGSEHRDDELLKLPCVNQNILYVYFRCQVTPPSALGYADDSGASYGLALGG